MTHAARYLLGLLAAITLAGCSSAPWCGNRALVSFAWPWAAPNELPVIPEVRSIGGVATVRLDAVAAPGGMPAFAYNGEPGVVPTIRVHAGDRIALTLHNALPPGGAHSGVNLHFHGFAVSPKAPGDDVLGTMAAPGQTVTYDVDIPRDHEPGLYWYHPHAHGTTYEQVAHGMSGAIVIEGIETHIAALASMRERILLLRNTPIGGAVHAHPSAATTLGTDPDDGGGDPCRPQVAARAEINGIARPRIAMAPGERQFFRVINASPQRYYDISLDGSNFDLVELDGVPLDAFPGTPAVRRVNHIVVPPAGRAEFVVTGPAAPALLKSTCYDSGPNGDAQPTEILADVVPRNGPAAAIAAETLRVTAPLPRNPLSAPQPQPAAHRRIVLTEDATRFFIGGKTFDPAAPPSIVARSGTVEEWTIVNDTDEVHAFHIHQVHLALAGTGGVRVRPNEWRDVVSVPSRMHHYDGTTTPGTIVVLVDFREAVIRGDFVYHCHILDHEDRGMMAKIRVV